MSGPLDGVRVVELAATGAVPFAAMVLADAGADVLRIDRPDPDPAAPPDLITRGRRGNAVGRNRRSVAVDLKRPGAAGFVVDLAARADVVLEGFRPGVAERLGIGPDACLDRNPALVYGRLTGWGRTGPLAQRPGHDINFLALSGTLSAVGPAAERPLPPLNLLADFGGGGMMLAFGVLAALVESAASGRGQVVDAAMVDGAASLATYIHSMRAAGTWVDRREANVLDGGAPFYGTYATADGGYMAVGAVEEPFYRELLAGLGLDPAALPDRLDRDAWPELQRCFAERFATRTRAEWTAVFDRLEACVTPVLSMAEAPEHPQLRERGAFTTAGGVVQPALVPRFGAHGIGPPRAPAEPGEGGQDALRDWGLDDALVEDLVAGGVVQVAAARRNGSGN
jgi:alpha-methylacyl-CoA racemase